MRVNEGGRLKLLMYNIAIKANDLCCFSEDKRKQNSLGDLKLVHSMSACEVKLVPPDVQLPLLRSSIIAETVEQTIEKLYRLEIRLSESHKRCFYMEKEA
jgi:hypothetical protein